MASNRMAILMGAVLVAGCSSGSGGSDPGIVGGKNDGTADVAAFCQKTAACGTKDIAGESFTQDECQIVLHGWLPPQGCVSAVQSASCSDFTEHWPNLSPSIQSVCAPKCLLENPYSCSADQTQWTSCDQDVGLRTFDCGAYCAGAHKTFSGVCGTSFGGQTSTYAKCWCS